jgi:S1-C subfamily serine protease
MSKILSGLSEALADVADQGGRSLVRVEARRRLPASGIIYSADGLIVTAHHVVRRDDNISVGLPDGQTVAATLAGRDPTTDLALLRVEATSLTPATWADPDALRVGHMVLALGRPGRTVQATLGIVSALGDAWRTHAGGQVDRYLQTDVVMYPGFSGGPLVDPAGQVLGLNTSALLRGVSLAVPAPTVRRVVETLQVHGRVRRGFLGVSTQPVRLPEEVAGQLGQETGLLLVSVNSGGPAGKAGLVLGDTVVGLDNERVRHIDDLMALLSADRVGAEVPVRFLRGGQAQEINVVIGERS